MTEPSQEQIIKAIVDFVSAQTWEESKRIVEVEYDKLLTNTSDLVLAYMLEQYEDDANANRVLAEHRDLLERCRRVGIEAAFADLVHADELQTLLSQIKQLRSPIDIPRRIMLCQTALQLLHRDTQPQLWIYLQNELAMSLAQNPLGE